MNGHENNCGCNSLSGRRISEGEIIRALDSLLPQVETEEEMALAHRIVALVADIYGPTDMHKSAKLNNKMNAVVQDYHLHHQKPRDSYNSARTIRAI